VSGARRSFTGPRARRRLAAWAVALAALACGGVPATENSVTPPASYSVSIVDLIPAAYSTDSMGNSEPNIAVNPLDPNAIAVSADLLGSGAGARFCAPDRSAVMLTLDGGATWAMTCPLRRWPTGSNPLRYNGPGDQSIDFSADGQVLFATYVSPLADMAGNTITRAIGVTEWADPAALSIQELTPAKGVNDGDQPYGVASRVKGSRTFVMGLNQSSGAGANKCSHGVVWLLDVVAAAQPACVARREGVWTEAVRPAVSASGAVYALFLTTLKYPSNDLVLVGGTLPNSGPPTFGKLREVLDAGRRLGSEKCASGGDGMVGVRLRRCITVADDQVPDPPPYPPPMGFQARGSNDAALAIDPHDDSHLVIAYGDSAPGDLATLHLVDVHLSSPAISGSTTWTETELSVVHNGLNPAVAMDADGRVGFLYQRWIDSTATQSFWETHIAIANSDSSAFQDVVLSRTPGRIPGYGNKNPYVGDYLALVSVGTSFYGVFSASNDPRFHCGTMYLRQVQNVASPCATRSLPAGVPVSIDPFFFKLERTGGPP